MQSTKEESMTTPSAAKILPILQSLPMVGKMQIIHALSQMKKQTSMAKKTALTIAKLVTAMERFNFSKNKSVTANGSFGYRCCCTPDYP